MTWCVCLTTFVFKYLYVHFFNILKQHLCVFLFLFLLLVQISLLKQSLELQLSQSQSALQQLQSQFNQERELLSQQLKGKLMSANVIFRQRKLQL